MNRNKLVFLVTSVALVSVLLTAALFAQASPTDHIYRYLSMFTEVFSLVRTNYVDQVESHQLIDGAFSGVTDAIDEYSYYVPPASKAEYDRFLESQGSELGLVVSKRLGYAYVITVVDDSPARLAGIVAGDFIERINGQLTTDLPLWKIQSELRGNEGVVNLVVVSSGMTERKDLALEKGPFERPEISLTENGGVPIVRVPTFEEGTAEGLRTVLADLEERESDRVILDLRQNGTGAIGEAIAAADLLLEGGTITSVSGRRIKPRTWEADRESVFSGRVVVLIDQSTASAAEIFAAAIGGNDRGELVGVPTYGRAIEQRVVDLPSGGRLNVTVGHYTEPDLEAIAAKGVKPDVQISAAALAINRENGIDKDLILDRALSILRPGSTTVN
ncbi:MAG TPA: S41 family peptidase [Thermoanaerobaculia bacterium]|nr:S41 family peptidase [Thermoanaerobaculia bacterium]